MIYTASYFEPTHQHGMLVSISRSSPAGFKVNDRLPFLAPSEDLLAAWKTKALDESGYVERYRTQIRESSHILQQVTLMSNP